MPERVGISVDLCVCEPGHFDKTVIDGTFTVEVHQFPEECYEGMRMRFSTVSSLTCFLLAPIILATLSGCTSATSSEAPAVTVEPAVESESNLAEAESPGEAESLAESASPGSVTEPAAAKPAKETATFGAGCFWCVEAVFEQLKGVENVRSGYTGGSAESATYKLVSNGNTGHAEVIQFEFDPSVITYKELLEVFWKSHDPTTLNQQGNDVGTQYRSAVFYHNDKQRELAETYKKRLNDENAFSSPVVTEITEFGEFYSAEGYHQDYFAANGNAPYCRFVVRPKVEKVRKVFADKLR